MTREELLEQLGITEDAFKPTEEQVTTQDLVDAIGVLTEIVLGGE